MLIGFDERDDGSVFGFSNEFTVILKFSFKSDLFLRSLEDTATN